jgi:hypothetical protein
VARVLAAAESEGLDAVSLAARQRVGSAGEALLTPLAFALLDALLGDWRAVAGGRGAPVANGQFCSCAVGARRDRRYGAIVGSRSTTSLRGGRRQRLPGRLGWRLEVRMYRVLASFAAAREPA